jgi:uncharacterized protein DUF6421
MSVASSVEAVETVVRAVDEVRSLQDVSGRIVRPADRERAAGLLRSLTDAVDEVAAGTGQPAFAAAFRADVAGWLARGLDAEPYFDAVRDAYRPPANGGDSLFCGAVLATNGPAPRGHFLEAFYVTRDEPAECDVVAQRLPHPKNKCQSARLRSASRGIREGNCIVFFPENIKTLRKTVVQEYALFFFNKFHAIYNRETMPRVRQLFGPRDVLAGEPRWRSAEMELEACYRARCVWGYMHDYYHHGGAWPIDEHLSLKLNWFVGLLEELKCDCNTALAGLEYDLPYAQELLQFILFERMFRYPAQPDAETNFDAGTGVLLFEWMLEHGGIVPAPGGGLSLQPQAALAALREFVRAVEALEAQDEPAYRAAAKAFVRRYLPEGAAGQRFRVSDNYRAYTAIVPAAELIDFGTVALY